MPELKQVGFLWPMNDGYTVICMDCVQAITDREYLHLTPIFRMNIYPYKQTCNKCKKVLVEPASPGWPELFTGK